MNTAGTVTVKIGADVKDMVRNAKLAVESVRSVSSAAKSATTSVVGLNSSSADAAKTLMRFAKGVAGIYAVKVALELASYAMSSFVNTAAQFEQYETTLSSITGSSEEAKKSMGWIKDFAQSTPYELSQVTESFVKLKAYGIDPTDGTLRTLGDTASAMGKPVIQAVEAMADALTGENERLKEFGIKASKQGDKIAYAWTDSSGRSKHIIIKNNKEMIQSTLEAIMNEKYTGAMEQQAKTLNGIISNISDSWTNFKSDMMSGGLFDYIKAIGSVVGDYLRASFDSAREGVGEFTKSSISMLDGVIIAGGYLVDVWHGIDLAWTASKLVFFELVNGIGKGIESIGKGFSLLGRGIYEIFTGAFNAVIKKYNEFIKSMIDTGRLDDWLRTLGITSFRAKDLLAKEIDPGKYEQFKVDLKWSDDGIKKAKKHLDELMDSIINQDGKKASQKMLDDIKKKLVEITKATGDATKAKEKYRDILKTLGMKDGDFKGFDKAAKSAKAANQEIKRYQDGIKDAQTKLKEARLFNIGGDELVQVAHLGDELSKLGKYLTQSQLAEIYEAEMKKMKKETDAFTETFKLALSSIFDGDFSSGFSRILDDFTNNLMKPFIDQTSAMLSKSLSGVSTSISGLFGGGSIGSFAAGFGIDLLFKGIGSLFSDEMTQAEIEAAKGRVDFTDESLTKLGNLYENALNPQLKATRELTRYTRDMRDNFGSLAKALGNIGVGSGVSLTGAGYASSVKTGFAGFSSTTRDLLSSGINIGGTLGDFDMNGYITELVKKSSWWGLKKKSYTTKKAVDLDASVISEFGDVINNGIASIVTSAVTLGYDKESIQRQLERSKIELGEIDLKGLTDQQVQERLSNAFSEMFSSAIDGLGKDYKLWGARLHDNSLGKMVDKYAKAGEEAMETLGRIAFEYEQVNYALSGISNQVGDIYNVLDVSAAFGDINQFNDAYNSYVENFLDDSEKLALQSDYLQRAFDNIGVAMPKTNEEFKNLIENFDWTAKGAAETYAELLGLSGAFAEYTDATEQMREATESMTQSIVDSINTIRDKNQSLIESLVGTQKDDLSYKFYAQRYNDISNSINSYFSNGKLKSDVDYDSFKKEYEQLVGVANNLKNYGYETTNDALLIDAIKFRDEFEKSDDVKNALDDNFKAQNELLIKLGNEIRVLRKEISEMREEGLDVYVEGSA